MTMQPFSNAPGDPILRVAAQLEYPDGSTRTITASSEDAAAVEDAAAFVGRMDGTSFSYAEAIQHTCRVQAGMDHVQALVIEGFTGRIWIALGLGTWDAWADKFFGNRPMLAFSREQRPALVASLSDAGLSTRAIGAALGVGQRTVVRDISSAESNDSGESAVQGVERRDKVAGVDGKDYTRPTPKVPMCEVCGERNEDCMGGDGCSEWQKYLTGERKRVPPGPPMPPLPRNPPYVPPALGHDTIFSNGQGFSSTADSPDVESERDVEADEFVDGLLCSAVNPEDAEVETEQLAEVLAKIVRVRTALVDGISGIGPAAQEVRSIRRLMGAIAASGMAFPTTAKVSLAELDAAASAAVTEITAMRASVAGAMLLTRGGVIMNAEQITGH
ncbi:hypothetical protein EH165_12840 [Nakamurella antarctica]|uniref:Uncharacterized protein n=1 Tax=Nakamurella antarctica TaxID=1902245 RepID=A0A3G8ZY06_9ACTN|nr:hypothetical protein [Nakamurella antarctica]AZI58896.1 hypothetical protein EH165_12840 [Nakamurella antarctica]